MTNVKETAGNSNRTYANPIKEKWRIRVHHELHVNSKCNRKYSERVGFIMPSANGAEIKTARDMGIRKLILGDYQLPVLEKAQRRRGKKGTVAIAGDLSVIGAEIARRGIALDFANLDICGYLGDKTINSVVPFVAAVDWRRGARICVNFRTARENKLTSQQFRKFADMTPRQWDRTDKVQRRDIKTAYIASLFETAVGAPLNVIYVETYVPRTKRKPHASIMQTVIVEIAA